MSDAAPPGATPGEPDSLLREDRDGLCTLTLNRPHRHNALDTALFERLEAEIACLETQGDSIGCVVLQASGPSFCAGADISAMVGGGKRPPASFKPGVIERLSLLPQIVVAKIRGNCVTGGLELALAVDIIVASDSARFADTHGRWGMVGGWGMSQRLPRRIGLAQAKLMMTTGRFVDAGEAHRIGLVDLLTNDDRLDAEVAALAKDILANSPHTNRETKKLLTATDGMSLAEGLAHEHYRHPGSAPDIKQRIAAFGGKG